MYMIDLPLDSAALMRFAWRQGHAGSRSQIDEDHGYAAHAWLAAALGAHMPRPFRLMETRCGLRLLGYGSKDVATLLQHALDFALPDALAVCDWSAAADKEMPTGWTAGRRLGFEVRVCPVIRGERERDLYLVEVDQAKAESREPASRAEVYVRWLESQLEREGAAHPVAATVNLIGFRRVRTMRRSRAGQSPRRQVVERPDALITGELLVGDPDRFGRLLTRGIGRHRAFGFGMLLLRPPMTGAA